jgi:small subunit ribosomal protein S5
MQIELEIKEEVPLVEKVIYINRVAKVTKGGKKISFSALVVVGDGKGKIGFALGKANEVADAIRKAVNKAKKSLVDTGIKGPTIPFEVIGKFKTAKILFKPASEGTGVIASGPVRAMCEAIGIKDILTKSLNSNNPINVVKATLNAFITIKEILSKYEARKQESAE